MTAFVVDYPQGCARTGLVPCFIPLVGGHRWPGPVGTAGACYVW